MSLKESLPPPPPPVSLPVISEAVLREMAARKITTEKQQVVLVVQHDRKNLVAEVEQTPGIITSLDQLPPPPPPPEVLLQDKSDVIVAAKIEYKKAEIEHETAKAEHETASNFPSFVAALDDKELPKNPEDLQKLADKLGVDLAKMKEHMEERTGFKTVDHIDITAKSSPINYGQIDISKNPSTEFVAGLKDTLTVDYFFAANFENDEVLGLLTNPRGGDARGEKLIKIGKTIMEGLGILPEDIRTKDGKLMLERALIVISKLFNRNFPRKFVENPEALKRMVAANAELIHDPSIEITVANVKLPPKENEVQLAKQKELPQQNKDGTQLAQNDEKQKPDTPPHKGGDVPDGPQTQPTKIS